DRAEVVADRAHDVVRRQDQEEVASRPEEGHAFAGAQVEGPKERGARVGHRVRLGWMMAGGPAGASPAGECHRFIYDTYPVRESFDFLPDQPERPMTRSPVATFLFLLAAAPVAAQSPADSTVPDLASIIATPRSELGP